MYKTKFSSHSLSKGLTSNVEFSGVARTLAVCTYFFKWLLVL
jgi:hypothetical protein